MSGPSVAERLIESYAQLEARDQQAVAAALAADAAGPQRGRVASTMPYGGSSSTVGEGTPDDMMDMDEEGAARGRSSGNSHTFGRAPTYGAAPSMPDGAWLGSLLAEGMMAQLERGYGMGGAAGELPFPASCVAPISHESSRDQMELLQHRLNQRLGPEYVESRRGNGGKNVEYIEGWKAIDLANEVFGFNGWSTAIRKLEIDFCDVSEEGKVRMSASCIMRITLRDGTFHEDVGCGMMEGGTSKGQAVQKVKKEAVTDAIKRTLKTFGKLTGNCLYDAKFREQIKKMKAAPPQFDLQDLKRGPDPVAVQQYKEAKAKQDAAVQQFTNNVLSGQQQQAPMQRASTSAVPQRSNNATTAAKPAAPAATRSAKMGPPPAPAAPAKPTAAPSEPVASRSAGPATRAKTTPAPGQATEAAHDDEERKREERLRKAAQLKEERRLKREAEEAAAAAAAQAKNAAPVRAQTSAARLPTAAAAASTDVEMQRPSTSQMFSDLDDDQMLSGVLDEFEATTSNRTGAGSSNEAGRAGGGGGAPDSDDYVDPLDDDEGAAMAMALEQQLEEEGRQRAEAMQRAKTDAFNDSAIALSDTSMAEVKKEYAENGGGGGGAGQPQPLRRGGSKGRFTGPAAASNAPPNGTTSGATTLSAITNPRRGVLGTSAAQRACPRTDRVAPLKRAATSVENVAQFNQAGSAAEAGQGQPVGHGFTGAGTLVRSKAAPYGAAARQQLINTGQPVEDASAAKRQRYA